MTRKFLGFVVIQAMFASYIRELYDAAIVEGGYSWFLFGSSIIAWVLIARDLYNSDYCREWR